MVFSKERYWGLRGNGLRGQGPTTRESHPVRRLYSSEQNPGVNKPLSRYAIRKNTKRARKVAQLGIS
jgi:hypothetical protein